jgi:uncharacterized protein YbjT (DUF2867 family)
MKKVLVLGGTGFVGQHVCAQLGSLPAAQAPRVTVPTRQWVNARSVQALPLVDVLQADVHDQAQLTELVRGHDAVVNLVAILHGSAADFECTHVQLVQKLVRACQASGVQRVVHISALGVSPDAPSMYLRSKAQGEAALLASGLAATVLRPSVIFGDGDKLLNLFARLQKIFPLLPLAAAHAQLQPVWVQDVATAVMNCLQQTHTASPVYECAGPEVMSLRELVQLAGRIGSHARPVIALPHALAQMQARLMELAPGPPLMSRDNLASLQVPNVASGQWPGLSALGIEPASVHTIAPSYLGRAARSTRLDAYRQH